MGPEAEVALQAEGIIGEKVSDLIDDAVVACEGDASDGGQQPTRSGAFGVGAGAFFWA